MATSRRELTTMSAELVASHVDARIARVAARQHGVISRAQLRALGLADSTIGARVAAGRLHRVHRGVYAVGHPVLAPRARWMAAVLTCGPNAALSHASAAALWEIRRTDATRTDVIVPSAGGRAKRARLRIHRTNGLREEEVTARHGIPVTTPARTILDLAAVLNEAQLERLLDQAEIEAVTDYPALGAMARAHPGHRGAAKLRTALDHHDAGATLTKSDLERLFLTICRDHGLPPPLVNQYVNDDQVDFLFPAHRLIVEADSWRYHRTRHRFERDRRRDVAHTLAGYRTLRFTDRDLEVTPTTIAHTLREALGERRAA
jgi:very-short-patch-repair endonuclease